MSELPPGKPAKRRYSEKSRAKKAAKAALRHQKKRAEILAKQRQYRLDNYEHVRALEKARSLRFRQRNPDKVKAHLHNWRQTHREHIYAYLSTYQPDYHAANPEKVRQWASTKNRNWRTRHPDRKRADNQRRRAITSQAPVNDLTAQQWQDILIAFKHCCAYCGRKMKQLTQDHVTPYIHGGSNTLWNIVPACRSCNAKKGAKGPLCPVQPLLL